MEYQQYIQKNDKSLVEIVNHLIIHSSSLNELGLYHGKSGIAIFFYHYYRYTNSVLYEDFAGELLDEVFDEINDGLSIDFENGYSGIGWAIQYLLLHKFIEGDSNDILYEIDKKIMAYDIQRINDNSFNNGLEGILTYILSRIICNKGISTFDKKYIKDIENISISDKHSMKVQTIINDIKSCSNHQYKCFNSMNLRDVLTNSEGKTINDYSLGLFDGYAYHGLKNIVSITI